MRVDSHDCCVNVDLSLLSNGGDNIHPAFLVGVGVMADWTFLLSRRRNLAHSFIESVIERGVPAGSCVLRRQATEVVRRVSVLPIAARAVRCGRASGGEHAKKGSTKGVLDLGIG